MSEKKVTNLGQSRTNFGKGSTFRQEMRNGDGAMGVFVLGDLHINSPFTAVMLLET